MSFKHRPRTSRQRQIPRTANLQMMYLEMASDAKCCSRMLTSPRSVSSVLLPFYAQLQSMAASFHGSANIRCVSTPSGGLSSRRAYLSSLPLSSAFMADQTFIILSALIPAPNSLRLLTMGLVSEVSRGGGGETRTPALKSPPTAGARHRHPPSLPPIPFPLSLWICTIPSDTLYSMHGAIIKHKRYPHLLFCLVADIRRQGGEKNSTKPQ